MGIVSEGQRHENKSYTRRIDKMERTPDWHAIGSRIQLLLVILYLIFELAEGQDTPKDECKSLHPVACVLYKEKIELFDNVTACTQHTEFKNYCPSLCPPCVVHEHHVNETCFKDVDEDCAKQIAGNKTKCKDLETFLHCHQTCTKCQEGSWQDLVLEFIGNNPTKVNGTETANQGEKETPEENEEKEGPEENEEKEGPEENEEKEGPEENEEKEGPEENEEKEGPEEKEEKEGPEENEEKEDPEKDDSNADNCKDSNDLCTTPKLLVTFLKITLKEDQDPCEKTAIQVMCRSTCKKCGDPDAEVPSLAKFKEMRQFIVDQFAPVADFFSTFFTKFV